MRNVRLRTQTPKGAGVRTSSSSSSKEAQSPPRRRRRHRLLRFGNNNKISSKSAAPERTHDNDLLCPTPRDRDLHVAETNDEGVQQNFSFREFVINVILLRENYYYANEQPLSESDRREIAQRINQDYTETLLRLEEEQGGADHSIDNDDDKLQAHLTAAYHVLHEFIDILKHSENATDDACLWVIHQTLLELVDEYLHPRTVNCYYDPSSSSTKNNQIDDILSRKNLTKIITWLDTVLSTIASLCPQLKLPPWWMQDLNRLVDQYLDGAVKQEMRQLIKRSLSLYRCQQQRDTIRADSEGHMVTGCPELIAYMYEQQLNVAKEMLPPKYQEIVLVACHTELACLVGDMMVMMMDNADEEQQMSNSRVYCAIINDACRFLELCDERNSAMLTCPEHVEAGDALACNLTHFALFVVERLCKRIMLDLKEDLSKMGSPSWQSGASVVVESSLLSLQDRFAECEQWLISGNYIFSKICKQCFDLLICEIVASFFINTMAHGVHSSIKVASLLCKDASKIEKCFDQYVHVSGFYTEEEIEARIQILKSMAALINPVQTVGAKRRAIRVLMSRLVCEGDRALAVWHLAGLQKPFDQVESKALLSIIEEIKETINADEEEELYRMPDLSNSKYLLPKVLQRESQLAQTKETIVDNVAAGLVRSALGTSLLTPAGFLASLAAVRLKDSVKEVAATGKQSRGASESDSYRFGDVTRGLSSRVYETARKGKDSVKEVAATGKQSRGASESDSYHFGDVTRGLTSRVYETAQKGKQSRGAPATDSYVFGDLTRGAVSSLRSHPPPSSCNDQHRQSSGSTKTARYGGVVGSSVGAVAGLSVLGPTGVVAGSVAGQVAGRTLFGTCKKKFKEEKAPAKKTATKKKKANAPAKKKTTTKEAPAKKEHETCK